MDKRQPLLIFKTYAIFWMICGSILVVNLLVYVLSVRQADARAVSLQKQYMAERKKHTEALDQDDTLKKYLNAKEALQKFRNMLPEENEARNITGELVSILRENGIDSEAVRLHPQEIEDLFVLKYGASITATGSYAEVKKLLADIQSSPTLFCIEKLSLGYQPGSSKEVKMDLTLTTYFKNSGKEQPDAG